MSVANNSRNQGIETVAQFNDKAVPLSGVPIRRIPPSAGAEGAGKKRIEPCDADNLQTPNEGIGSSDESRTDESK